MSVSDIINWVCLGIVAICTPISLACSIYALVLARKTKRLSR